MNNKKDYKIAYFSMEIALEADMETYAGGLGILAGDILNSAADLGLPMIGMSLLNNKGYFHQSISSSGDQSEAPEKNYNFTKLQKMPTSVTVNIGSDEVKISVWEYLIKNVAPVYFLDTNLPENKPEYQDLTSRLYGGDKEYRLKQEIILGRGGVKMLTALGYQVDKFHINEGHGVMAAIELFLSSKQADELDKVGEVKKKVVFTIHTSVKAAQDILPVEIILKSQPDFPINLLGLVNDNKINLTEVGVYFSNYINAVSLSHKKVLEKIFPDINIHAVTNGVRALTWTAPEFQTLYDKYIPGWRLSSSFLVEASNIPLSEIWETHQKAKERLFDYIREDEEAFLQPRVLTIGF
ncbi:MAG: alpha-glucan family phosphorylase, partial [Candidatus Falkowbacteria bacterium]|nr:alpha-glucan family phosphorylase [Candidatus Falkowbacteria bacterium]